MFGLNKNLSLFQIKIINHIVTNLVQYNSKTITIPNNINSLRKILGYTYYINQSEQVKQNNELTDLFDLIFLTKYTNNNSFSRMNLDNARSFDDVNKKEKIEEQ